MRRHLPHICFIAPNAFPLLADDADIELVGGAELQQVIVARELVRLGYPVSMICLNFGQRDRCEVDGIIVHRAFRPAEGLPVLRFIWPRLTSIWRCLKTVDADIYYQRAASMMTGVMAAFCRLHGKKSIFAVAGDPMIRFSRDKWIYEYGIRHVDRVFVQNSEQERFVRQHFGRDSILIPNCYEAARIRTSVPRKFVLWVSTIRQLKRPDLFLDVAQALPGYQFTMVGGMAADEAPLYEETRARAEKLENVDFVGFVPYAKVNQYFDNAILFVNTSDSEGFPNTFLQSWARGVPTVSFVDSGARVNGEPIGRVVDSIDDMRAAVGDLLERHTERTRLGAECKIYVERNHGTDRILGLYQDAFRRILEEDGPVQKHV